MTQTKLPTNIDSLSPKQAFNSPMVQNAIKKLMDGHEAHFATSLLSIINNNSMLSQATNTSILSAAMKSAALKLPIDASMGYAYIVPFRDNRTNTVEAQFQLGYRGLIQLAQRSGQIKSINSGVIYEGELRRFDRIHEEIILNEDVEINEDTPVVGYFASFETVSGFKKTSYWSKEQIMAHVKKFSQAWDKKKNQIRYGSAWYTNFDSMAQKTVLKNILSKYAPLSIETFNAIVDDNHSEERKDVTDSAAEQSAKEFIESSTEEQPIEQTEDAQFTEQAAEQDIFEDEIIF